MSVKLAGNTTATDVEVDTTPKAMRTIGYDTRGNAVTQKATYSAGLTFTATAAGTGIFFNIIGSGTKTVRVQKLKFEMTVATAAVTVPCTVNKRTAAATGGTATTLTAVAHDSSNSAATAVAKYFTVLATAGTGGGMIANKQTTLPLTAAGTAAVIVEFNHLAGDVEGEAWVLRGTGESLEVNFTTTTTNAPSMTVEVMWTEE